MIAIYILHIEFHWGYWPKISIKRKPKHGQYAVDGGYPGTLKLCPTCQDGFLFEQDPYSKSLSEQQPLPPGPHAWEGTTCIECEADVSWCPYPPSRPRSDHQSAPAMDFNAPMPSDFVEAPLLWDMDWTIPASVRDIPLAKVSMAPRGDENLTELLLLKDSLTYSVGSIVWYNKCQWRVEAFEPEKRVLLRRLPE